MKKCLFSFCCLLAWCINAHAINGFFNHGIGTKNKGMAGAGVALAEDAISGGLNPANLAHLGTRVDFGASIFAPKRGFTVHDNATDSSNQIRPGYYKSKIDIFLLPQFGFNYQINEKSSVGLIVIPGGGNSEYTSPVFNDVLWQSASEPTGTDFFQLYVHMPYSRKITDEFSFGIGPVFAVQTMRLRGLQPFKLASDHPDDVTNNSWDFAYGVGASAGLRYQAHEHLSFGVGVQFRINMSKFDRYRGTIADDGNLDIPESFQVGMAFNITDDITLLADYQRIYYDQVKATGNEPSAILQGTNVGGSDSPSGGWDNANIKKVGIRWQYDPKTVLRAGYSHSNQITPHEHLLVNYLAPLAAEDHISIGATREFDNGHELSVSLTYSPRETPSGKNVLTGQSSDLLLRQTEFEVTYAWKF